MSNDRLAATVTTSGFTVEQLARTVDVDPKTVQRWLSGRTPHPRHRYALAHALGETEEFLWPGVGNRLQAGGRGSTAEVVAAYPHRTDLNPDRWWTFLSTADARIDLLGYTLYFLPHQHPELVDLLQERCDQGSRVRIVLADPQSEHVRRRDEEERDPITLIARIESSLQALGPLLDYPNADLRFQDAPLYNSIFRSDDQMLVTPHLYATPGRSAPMLHLRRLGPNGIFSTFASHFEAIWADSRPIMADDLATRTPSVATPQSRGGGDV